MLNLIYWSKELTDMNEKYVKRKRKGNCIIKFYASQTENILLIKQKVNLRKTSEKRFDSFRSNFPYILDISLLINI